MKRTRTLALLAMAAMATTTALMGPVEAYTGAASTAAAKTVAQKATQTGKTTGTAKAGAAVRYAWVRSCEKGDFSVPCGAWTLTLRNGRTVKLSDAVVYPRDTTGVDKESSAPIAVSGDGSRLVYFRKSDGKLVWRNASGGGAHSLPGASAKPPKGLGMSQVDPWLSPDGDTVVIDYGDATGKCPTLVVHLGSGDIVRLPGRDTVQGFSPDGRKILLAHGTEENTTEFTVYGTDGEAGESREVPQVVSNNSPVALANDGVTVAVVITPSAGKHRLRQYDLSTDAVSPAIDLGMPSTEIPYRIDWDDDNRLTLWRLHTDRDGTPTRAIASRVDPSTGGLRTIDSFPMRTKIFIWWLPGE
ncbi:hypothetical protein Sme01_22200 [Sphaerisporangium melleum]|uniref:Uncharacterized protein n=1 Tax=Sphaerisporangium melleum TaxID=321316 RepID=A0A917R051_9ACTN|nr:hypothetical protein [Sphaerisporangium melleum]GGK79120.1 hypothetical protein GCM10007964_22170 [Sphaerisporangium melleum]GII69744.1 hypothetical protein Sme01_22200 [Sphaerisporangium melleum]